MIESSVFLKPIEFIEWRIIEYSSHIELITSKV